MEVTRRKFLTAAGVTTAALWAPKQLWANPMGLPIGIQLYTVRKALQASPADTLKQLYRIGFREIETAGFVGKSAKEFHQLLDDAGLTCPSAHLQLTAADLGPAFADAHALGAKYATSSSLANGNTIAADSFKRLAEQMNNIGQKAKAAGLTYAYHNHNMEFIKLSDGSYGYDLLLRETDPELVKFEADCGWLTVAGVDPVHYLEQYPGRYRMLHVKDFPPVPHPTTAQSGPDRPEGIELGHGFVQYKRIFEAGKAAGIQHAFAEQESPFAHSEMESAQVSYDFLRSFS